MLLRRSVMKIFGTTGPLALVLFSISAGATEYPAPKQGDWIARDFRFHTGEVMPELKLHYTTVGDELRSRMEFSEGTPIAIDSDHRHLWRKAEAGRPSEVAG